MTVMSELRKKNCWNAELGTTCFPLPSDILLSRFISESKKMQFS